MLSALTDLRYGLRALRGGATAPLFITLALSLGIGLTATIVSTAATTLLTPLPYRDPDRLVAGVEGEAGESRMGGDFTTGATLSQLYALRGQIPALGAVGAFALEWPKPIISTPGGSRPVVAATISANLFATLGIVPALGKLFDETDDDPAAAPTAILSHALWERAYGADPSVIGRLVTIEGVPTRIAGVLARDQQLPMEPHSLPPDLWRPLSTYRTRWNSQLPLSRPDFEVIARLRPGAKIAQAQSQATVASRRAWSQDSLTTGFSLRLSPLHDFVVGDTRAPVELLLLSAAIALCLAVANTLGIVLMGVTARRQEAAVRYALGGNTIRVLGPHLYPLLALTAASGAIGLGLAGLAVKTLGALTPREFAAGHSARMTSAGIAAGVAATILTALMFAIAIYSAHELGSARGGPPHTASRPSRRSRRTTQSLILAEVALTVVFLATGGMLLRSLERLLLVDPGFQSSQTVLARLRLTRARYPTLDTRLALAADLQRRLAALPDAAGAAIASATPLSEGRISNVWTTDGTVHDTSLATVAAASNDLFAVLGIPFLRGQLVGDAPNRAAVAVVNDELARRYFGAGNAIGRHIMLDGQPFTIAGIVGSTATLSLGNDRMPQVYLPLRRDSLFSFNLIARARAAPANLIPVIRRLVTDVDPQIGVDTLATSATILAESSAKNRYFTLLVTCAGLIALAMAATGIYGAVSYAAERRTRELAIRIAVGAQTHDIFAALASWIVLPCVLGLATGLMCMYWSTPVLHAVLYHEPRLDPWALGGTLALLTTAAALATLIPGRRALRIDPARLLASD
jgi:putative ABC transport system permease protein